MIHDYGIEPDILIPMTAEDWTVLVRERMQAPPNGAPRPGGNGAPPAPKDPQLDRAVDVLKGIMLFKAESERHAPKAG